jgi:hypothetical protein
MNLDDIKRVTLAASPGPWIESGACVIQDGGLYDISLLPNNRKFIAAAREWVPRLVAAVERLEGDNRRLREAVDELEAALE